MGFLLTFSAALVLVSGAVAYFACPEKAIDAALVYGAVKGKEVSTVAARLQFAATVLTTTAIAVLALWGLGAIITATFGLGNN